MKTGDRLPGYEPMLRAFHRAFASELREAVRSLPIREGHTVLDMACGDGAYIPWLAECAGKGGRVVAVDANPEYLEMARESNSASSSNVEFLRATIDDLPFEEGRFDLCWCAQSLYSLPEPVEALRCMLRVTKPGGFVAVLENDTLHHVLLPWPIDLELAARAAESQELAERSGDPQKFYVSRNLRAIYREAGFDEIAAKTVAFDRSAPLGADARAFLTKHVMEFAARAAKRLDEGMGRKLKALTDPGSKRFLLDDPNLTATCINQVAWGGKRRQAKAP